MDKDTLRYFVDSPEFIPGIFNYCDRWCERCAYTARCMNFALGEKEVEDPEVPDMDSEDFWEELNETFQASFELLHELAEAKGVTLDAVDAEGARERERTIRKASDAHPCTIAAKHYMELVNEWFDAAENLLHEREHPDDVSMHSDIPTPVVVFPGADDELEDTVEEIRWRRPQIYVKIMRALRGRQDEFSQFGIPDEFPNDSDGSAKVALIDIDRSINAWGKMCHYLPELKAASVRILVHLEGLRDLLEGAFPNARTFVRPGFDDPVQYPAIGNS